MKPPRQESRLNGTLPITSPAAAANRIPDAATVLVSGFGSVGYPKEVPRALARADRDLSLTLISGGSVGGEIDVELTETDAIARRFPYQGRREIRNEINDGRIEFHDRNISTLGDEVRYGAFADADVAVVEAVAVGEDWLIPSTSIGHTPTFVESADTLIVEVNDAQPLELQRFHDVYLRKTPPDREPIPLGAPAESIGTSRVQFDPEKLVAVVETDRRDEPYTFRDPTDTDLRVADNLSGFLETETKQSKLFEESVRLQFGVGSLGNALMSALGDAEFGDKDLIYFGEVIQDGLLDLLDNGELRGASATSLALSAAGQDRLFENVDKYSEDVVLRPAALSNSPALIDRFGVISVNSALEVDIYGHVNSTHLNGTHVVNGVGGSGDFNRHSALAVVALGSTAADGDISRIVPMVPHVDHTEHDIDVVVTEQGVADLRGLSPRERAHELIRNCAYPAFRDELKDYFERACEADGHVPHDLGQVFSWDPGNG
ncbi:Acetyl-CoA hydrolase (plasmid) [halophilic archaeon DL31]|nr:Acetyl-CoA hydrolase [halophilic archaeon DL31]